MFSSGSHTFSEDGVFLVVVTVTGPGLSLTSYDSAVVTDYSFTLTPADDRAETTNRTFTGDLATLSFTGMHNPYTTLTALEEEYQAEVDWGDGSTTTGIIVGSGAEYTISGSHSYNKDGNYIISVDVLDVEDDPQNSHAPVTLLCPIDTQVKPLDAEPVWINDHEPVAEGESLNDIVVAAFTDINPAHVGSDHTATINWGDGSSVGTIDTTLEDDLTIVGDMEIKSGLISASDVGQALYIVNSPNGSESPGWIPGQYKIESFSGGTATLDKSPGPIGSTDGLWYFQRIEGSHVYAEEGNYLVAVTIFDDVGNSDTAYSTLRVTESPDLAPVASLFSAAGETYTNQYLGEITFPYPEDFSNGTDDVPTVLVDWGDGSGGYRHFNGFRYAILDRGYPFL